MTNTAKMSTPPRQAVKVLLLDERDRVLLLRGSEDGKEGFWFPVGGGIEPGETPERACYREVAEETGCTDVDLRAEVWRRTFTYPWRGVEKRVAERWFLAQTGFFTPVHDGMTEEERDYVTGSRWWTAEDLQVTAEVVFPATLGSRLARLLCEGPPDFPVEIGDE